MADRAEGKPAIQRLYLDTQPLRASQWPAVSVALENMLALANRVGVPILLPDAVERERRSQFLRDLREATQQRAVAARSLQTLVGRAGGAWQAGEPPREDEVMAAYDREAVGAKAKYRIGTVPLPLPRRALADLFDALLQRQPPFDEKGRGFGDALIYESIVDDLTAMPETRGLLVSADSDFRGIDEAAERRGVKLEVGDVPVATERLLDSLTEAIGQEYSKRYGALLVHLYVNGQEITRFLAANLTFPLPSLASFFETVIGLEGIENFEVQSVSAQPALWKKEIVPGIEVALTVVMKIKLIVVVSTLSKVPPKTIRVGETAQQDAWKAPEPVVETRNVEREVELSATVVVTEQGYEGLTLLGASLREREWGTLGALAAGVRQNEPKGAG